MWWSATGSSGPAEDGADAAPSSAEINRKTAATRVLDPATEAARIRAFFVHPAHARRGLGRKLLVHCEAAAKAAGFGRAELMATLPGVPLYQALGYEALETVIHPMPGGQQVEFVRMGRALE